ncbi:MAG: ABC transporter permease subunit, partial [Clostridia bacterium]
NCPLAIVMALAINLVRGARFKKIVQTITYMPHFISTVVLVGIIYKILHPISGMYGNMYRLLFGSGYPDDILIQSGAFRHLYVWSGTWQNLGWNTIIYIAALSGVDPELHEAAQIDGASRLKRVFYIDFPVLLPTAAIMLILNAGNIMGVGFEKVYLLQNNANLSTSEVISTYIYKMGMSNGTTQFSFASAVGLFNSLVNCVMLLVFNKLAGYIGEGGYGLF